MTYELPPNPLGGLASDIDLTVAVAGDEPARRRIAVALHRDGLHVTAEAVAPDQLADACQDSVPHVAVLARSACRPHAAAAVRATRRQLPRTRVVVVATEDRSDDVRGAVDSGADAVVVESRLPATLSVTVRAVCAGQACLPRELRRQFDRPALSGRERQVVGMVAAGYTNAEIADQLYLAESTVKGHLAAAFSKLGVHSREEAAALVHDPEADRLGIPLLAPAGSVDPSNNGARR
jgi:DNA-binding NarL/FixJ family response regulator